MGKTYTSNTSEVPLIIQAKTFSVIVPVVVVAPYFIARVVHNKRFLI